MIETSEGVYRATHRINKAVKLPARRPGRASVVGGRCPHCSGRSLMVELHYGEVYCLNCGWYGDNNATLLRPQS